MSKNLIGSSLIIGCGILALSLPCMISHKAAIASTNSLDRQLEQNALAQPIPSKIAVAIDKSEKTITTPSGLKYTILKAGKGATPKKRTRNLRSLYWYSYQW
jgi:hypothetical protein